MFNDAVNRCFEKLQSLQDGIICVAPKLIYNNDNTFSIYYDDNFSSDISLYVNDDLFKLFGNFSSRYEMNNGINNMKVYNTIEENDGEDEDNADMKSDDTTPL